MKKIDWKKVAEEYELSNSEFTDQLLDTIIKLGEIKYDETGSMLVHAKGPFILTVTKLTKHRKEP